MNRQVRRIEEKKERKQEEAKAKAKAERAARRRERQAARDRGAAKTSKEGVGDGAKAGGAAKRRGADPGRFSGALMIATLFFIALQGVTPSDGLVSTQVIAASFYLLFGYFAVLWLMRRGTERPLPIAVGIGLVLGLGTAASQWLLPDLEPAPIMLALIAPLLLLGAFLGRLVYVHAPR